MCAVLCSTTVSQCVDSVVHNALNCIAWHYIPVVLFAGDVVGVGAEQRECPSDQLRCASGQCISKADFCSFPLSDRDCRDGSLRRIDHCSKS